MDTERKRRGKVPTISSDPFAQTLASIAERHGLTRQTDLAIALGINQSSISTWFSRGV